MEEEIYYHIYNRANGNENLFRNEDNYNYFLSQWAKYIEPIAETYCYCLMPNHFHFLIKIRKEQELMEVFEQKLKSKNSDVPDIKSHISKQFSNLFNSYSKAYNKMYERNGSLFQRPFKSKKIVSDSYLTNIIFYIHHNPIHHGFTSAMEDWKHSSYPTFFTERETKIKRQFVTEWFGGKEAFKIHHRQNIRKLDELELEFT